MKRAAILMMLVAACGKATPGVDGDPARGRMLMARYGCASCHDIPGIAPSGMVGPPLNAMSRRAYIAGKLPNVPQNMIGWLRDPQLIDPGNVMPNLGVNERDARDMTAYLATLR